MTIENQLHAFLFLYLIKPRFYYISACLMRSTSHGDVSMMVYAPVYNWDILYDDNKSFSTTAKILSIKSAPHTCTAMKMKCANCYIFIEIVIYFAFMTLV